MNTGRFVGRMLAAVAIVVGTFAMTAGPAAAAPSATAVPTVERSETTTAVVTVTAAKESCWYHHSVQSGVLLGKKLWVFEQIVNWCGTGKKVTRITSNRVFFSHLAGAMKVDREPSSTISKPSANEWIDRSTTTVKFCLLRVGCTATYRPWIEAYLYGNGTRNSQGGF